MDGLRFAFRQLRKSPGFSALAIITLAIGIGLNTAIFSLINDLFLRGLPFKEPSRVVHLFGGDKSRDLVDIGVSAPRYQHFRDGQTVFDGLAAESFFLFTFTGIGDPVQVFGGRVTSNYFDVLSVRPILGRNFLPQEQEGAVVAVVTKNFWQKRLGGDANVIGRSITLDGTTHTIVGVLPNMPATWFGANPIAEVWTTKPFQVPGFTYERMMRGTSFLRVIDRKSTRLNSSHQINTLSLHDALPISETPRRRCERDRAQHHTRWHHAHDRRRVAKHARDLVRGEPNRGSLDDEAVPGSGVHV